MNTTQLVAALAGGAAAGALLTALTSVFTGWLTRRHEHRRWLLDKRLEIYSEFNTAVAAFQGAYIREAPSDELADRVRDLAARRAHVELIAPPATTGRVVEVFNDAARLLGTYEDVVGQRKNGNATTGDAAMLRLGKRYTRLLNVQMQDLQGIPSRSWTKTSDPIERPLPPP